MVKTKGESGDSSVLSDDGEAREVAGGDVANKVRTKILEATSLIAKTEGLDAATPTRIYAATGIARSTIYRHWPKRVELLRAAIEEDEQVRQEKHRRASSSAVAVRLAAESFKEDGFVRMLASIMSRADAGGDDAGAEWRDLAKRLLRVRLRPFFEFIDRAFEEGRVCAGLDREQVLALCLGPLVFQRLVLSTRLTNALVEQQIKILDQLVVGVGDDVTERDA